MALTDNNFRVFDAIARSDMHSARIAALASLAEDSSKKNKSRIENCRRSLRSGAAILMPAMPENVKNSLVGVMPVEFNSGAYYVRDADDAVAREIMTMRSVSKKMAEHGISYPNSAILYGKSGTGKTMLAKYIACKMNLPLFYVSYATIIGGIMGQTAGKIHDIFDACKSIPCVLMLDEIDCVAVNRTNRGGKGADGELERTTISLMQEMDALPNHVTLMAATNRIEMMDDAVLRRFSIKHEVTEMQTWDTEAMLRQFVRATGTEQYIGNDDILKIVTVSNNPGIAMTELKKKIGAAMYNEVGCKPAAEMRASEDVELPIWTVTYTWQKDICAETKEEAIAAGMGERRSFAYTGAVKPLEQYDAHIKTE